MDNQNSSWGDYVGYVADYIEQEYDATEFSHLTIDEKWTIRNMIDAHYFNHSSVSNASSDIIDYLKSSRQWMKDSITFNKAER